MTKISQQITAKYQAYRKRGPLERPIDWMLTSAGVIVFGILGYIWEGQVVSVPLLVALGVVIMTIVEHRRRHARRGEGANK
jgi:4-hydroxybenzoate polyprenyltransferase